MFPFKKKSQGPRPLKKADALITGLILGGVVASVYGINRARKNETPPEETPSETPTAHEPAARKKAGFAYRLYHAVRYGKDVDQN